MKYFSYPLLFFVSVLFFAACNTTNVPVIDDPIEPVVIDLKLDFENVVEDAPLKFGLFSYENAAGNTYMVSSMKYYVSNIRLINIAGDTIAYEQFELIDASDNEFSSIVLEKLPIDIYTQILFNFGIDSAHNHDGDQFGDLDPVNGMIWTWATGYLFFKHEGKFINADGNEQFLLFHYGTDRAFVPDIAIALNDLDINANISTLYLQFDLDGMYRYPNVIDFNEDNNRQSISEADLPWIGKLKQNTPNAFSFGRVE